jgi:hypothetical protein
LQLTVSPTSGLDTPLLLMIEAALCVFEAAPEADAHLLGDPAVAKKRCSPLR